MVQSNEEEGGVGAGYQQVDAHMVQHLQDAGRCMGEGEEEGDVRREGRRGNGGEVDDMESDGRCGVKRNGGGSGAFYTEEEKEGNDDDNARGVGFMRTKSSSQKLK